MKFQSGVEEFDYFLSRIRTKLVRAHELKQLVGSTLSNLESSALPSLLEVEDCRRQHAEDKRMWGNERTELLLSLRETEKACEKLNADNLRLSRRRDAAHGGSANVALARSRKILQEEKQSLETAIREQEAYFMVEISTLRRENAELRRVCRAIGEEQKQSLMGQYYSANKAVVGAHIVDSMMKTVVSDGSKEKEKET